MNLLLQLRQILRKFIPDHVLNALVLESKALSSGLKDYRGDGCVVEPVSTGSVPPDHPSRTNWQSYAALRRNLLSSGAGGRVSDCVLGFFTGPVVRRRLRSLLGGNPVLFNEHYVMKPPHSDSSFGWHRVCEGAKSNRRVLKGRQDRDEQLAWCRQPRNKTPYVSLWCALTTMTGAALAVVQETDQWPAENGTLCVPGGDDCLWETRPKGTCLCVSPGDVVAFSSHLWHSSPPNTSNEWRMAYYSQYSVGALTPAPGDATPLALAVPMSGSTGSKEPSSLE